MKAIREDTGYKDINGKNVYTGDTIDFCWWSCAGMVETHIIGTIRKRKGKLVFLCKQGQFSLSTLNFDSECDWEIIYKKK